MKLRDNLTGKIIEVNDAEAEGYLRQTMPSPKQQTPSPEGQYQQAWNAAPDLSTKNKIATAYKSAFGKELFAEENLSAAEKKRAILLSQSTPVLTRIIDAGLKAPTGLEGSMRAAIGGIPGVEGGEAEFLSRDTQGFARLIASAFASEVGVATDKDIDRWSKIMPKPGDTVSERIRQSEKLIEQISSEAKSLGISVPPEILELSSRLKQVPTEGNKTTKSPVESAIDLLFPNVRKFSEQTLPSVVGKTNPTQDILASIGGPLTQSLYGTAETKQAQAAGQEVVNALMAAQAIKSLPSKVSGLFSPNKAISARKEASEGVKVFTNTIKSAGDKYVKEINPAAKKTWDVLKATLGKEKDLGTLLEQVTDWGNKAYTESGDVRAITEGLLKNYLYGAARETIKNQAPEMAKLTGDISGAMARQELLKKIGLVAGGGAATGLTFSLLNKLGLVSSGGR